ncbi:TetR/AcrR family transcriptional regulator [Embleya scabrispora]|uniref:TetR/AcrR family transcriptional regulator n=1 Tax=Embleya scabrispora TaxID=159449 RepID=UPI00037F9CFF|nr:TetR/AcrR family transcriptional regulator [Embleya scabrispora]MYS87501.1 TetR family transcriptional regulator [Streptomyces sp. SID5474]
MTGQRGDTRRRVRETALTLFADKTYGATTLQDIADAMGVTKAALYYYFRTKEEILADLVEPAVAELEEILDRAEGQSFSPAATRELLLAMGELYAGDRRRLIILMFDRTFKSVPVLGERAMVCRQRTQQALARGSAHDSAGDVRAIAALAALTVPLAALEGYEDLHPLVGPAVAAACAVLGIRPPRGGAAGTGTAKAVPGKASAATVG